MLDLPAPVYPTSAVTLPGSIVKVTSWSTGRVVSG